MNKKSVQLGMNPSTASGRLLKDILFQLVCETGKDKCFHCGEKITRETLSIEHKTPWLDSDDPQGLFFDLDNIAFSHLLCNTKAARKGGGKCGTVAQYKKRGCRCEECRAAKAREGAKNYSPDSRKERYLKTGH